MASDYPSKLENNCEKGNFKMVSLITTEKCSNVSGNAAVVAQW